MGWFLALLKPAGICFRIVGSAVRKLRDVPVIDDWCCRVESGLLNPVVVRQIRNPTDGDLHVALDLYDERIPEDERFPRSDIINWIAENRQLSRHDRISPRNYLLVAKFQRKVRAFVLFHFYPARKIAFFAYMVAEKGTKGNNHSKVSARLVDRVASLVKGHPMVRNCEMLIFEVEDPRVSITPAQRRQQLHDIARVQLFCALAAACGCPLIALDFPYLQPQLSIPDGESGAEKPLLLLVAPIDRQHAKGSWEKGEVLRILSFIYEELYPKGFSPVEELTQAYKEYCSGLYRRMERSLADSIKVVDPAYLTCGRNIRKSVRRRKSEVG